MAEASRTKSTTCSATRRLQTKTESEKAFQLGFVASLGNVKAFILGICGAVVFAIMLVSGQHHGDVGAQPHARSGGAEDAGLHPEQRVLSIFVSESVALAVSEALLGVLVAIPVISGC